MKKRNIFSRPSELSMSPPPLLPSQSEKHRITKGKYSLSPTGLTIPKNAPHFGNSNTNTKTDILPENMFNSPRSRELARIKQNNKNGASSPTQKLQKEISNLCKIKEYFFKITIIKNFKEKPIQLK